jgi:hypothetical protein
MVILQAFDLDFISAKSKKSLVFAELISELPVELGDVVPEESPIWGDMFLIESSDSWYRDIMIYRDYILYIAASTFSVAGVLI